MKHDCYDWRHVTTDMNFFLGVLRRCSFAYFEQFMGLITLIPRYYATMWVVTLHLTKKHVIKEGI